MGLSLSGQRATVVWGYRQAGTLSAWSVAPDGQFSATLEDGDRFALGQTGLEVRVARASGAPWRLPVVDRLTLEGRTVTGAVRLSD